MGRESQLVGERKVGKGYTHSLSALQLQDIQTVIYSNIQYIPDNVQCSAVQLVM